MRNSNLLTLHEAIAIALLKYPKWRTSYINIAQEIEKRGLYDERKGGVDLAKQCFLRAKNYTNLFELVGKDEVRLRNGGQ